MTLYTKGRSACNTICLHTVIWVLPLCKFAAGKQAQHLCLCCARTVMSPSVPLFNGMGHSIHRPQAQVPVFHHTLLNAYTQQLPHPPDCCQAGLPLSSSCSHCPQHIKDGVSKPQLDMTTYVQRASQACGAANRRKANTVRHDPSLPVA